MEESAHPGRGTGGGVALFAVAGLLVTVWAYLPGMGAGFYFDDLTNLVDDPALHWTELSTAILWRTATDAHLPLRWVANATFGLNHLLFGLSPESYHWTNLILHLLTGAVLAWVAWLYLGRSAAVAGRRGAAAMLVAVIFLVHPLNTQAVTYVIQRMTVLAALLCLTSFGLYLWARDPGATRRRRRVGFVLSVAAWVLAVFSKENSVALPLVAGAYEASFHGRAWLAVARRAWASSRTRWTLVTAGAAAGVVGAVALERLASRGLVSLTVDLQARDFSGVERLLTEGRVHWLYVSLLGWPAPSRLTLDHDVEVSRGLLTPWTTLPAIVLWLLVAGAAVRLARRRPLWGFPLVAYLVLHAIESGPISLELAFEHRMYLPLAALSLMGAVALAGLGSPARSGARLFAHGVPLAAVGVAVAVVVVLAVGTHERNRTWGDSLTFHADTAAKAPGKYRPVYNYGTALGKAGRLSDAERVLRQAVAVGPERAEAHNQLGNVYLFSGRAALAVGEYETALRLDPEHPEAVYNLARRYEALGRAAEARALDRRFVAIAPWYLEAQRRAVAARLGGP
ncbi:MAG: tetratricopeptide repeat protein [Deltaproteobacteria bacterium]|nr:tetratricopeptide repeat protein [Deltaproteobacteria bacterium]